eukprot:CAMPEP_0119339256 /NCGR_PEP_ID=MMETSP1333-20130426/97897_1 /TAXON_ID=418940 /ORGANISM="Scyphosphaera apsteinii, Strain RCC1455" /LENGTH=440 /DNA_ID=CAMNT_0007350749 /DNA_START=226 /DNA_END=1548 /DNA_ORIENTATION=+
MIGIATGLSSAALGRAVFINRCSKLLGTFFWTAYARTLQEDRDVMLPPRIVLCSCLLVSAACALAIASPVVRGSALVLQTSLALFGISYGFTDPGFTLLTIWKLHDSARQQRTHVAYLNAGYTLGALMAPALLAVSLSTGGSCYFCFYALAALACAAAFCLAVSPATSHEALIIPARRAKRVVQQRDSDTSDPAYAPKVIGAMALVLFCVTGCEHGVATWLPTFGHIVSGVPLSAMALMSSTFWGAICTGRLAWAALSDRVTSGWRVLILDASVMLISAFFFILFAANTDSGGQTWQLWVGAIGLGLGFASSLPCAITLPSEAHVTVTPSRLFAMNLGGSAGEMFLPFLFGAAFDQGWYAVFGPSLVAMQVTVLSATAFAWHSAREPDLEAETELMLEAEGATSPTTGRESPIARDVKLMECKSRPRNGRASGSVTDGCR